MPILLTALVVALLDAAFAIAFYWNILHAATPARVFQSIAAGFLGKAAVSGGGAAVALGVVTHFVVTLGWTLVYTAIVSRIPVVQRLTPSKRGQLIVGFALGAAIWIVMDFIVMPLSRATPQPVTSWRFYGMLAWHIVGVGPAIVLLSERAPARRIARTALASSLQHMDVEPRRLRG